MEGGEEIICRPGLRLFNNSFLIFEPDEIAFALEPDAGLDLGAIDFVVGEEKNIEASL